MTRPALLSAALFALQACVFVAPDSVEIGGKGSDQSYTFDPPQVSEGDTQLVSIAFPKDERDKIDRVVGVRFEQSPLEVDDWQTSDEGVDVVVTAPADSASAAGTAVLELDDGTEMWLDGGAEIVP